MPDTKPLLDPDFLARLQRLEIVSKKIFVGKTKGERLSKRKGQSVEFADFRSYAVGDDLRFLDWNFVASSKARPFRVGEGGSAFGFRPSQPSGAQSRQAL